MTCWSYTVVSSDRQEDSLDFQEQWARDVATAHGWTIQRSFKGVSSGKDGTRKLLLQLLEQLRDLPKPLRPKRILMVRLDRTGRGIGLDALSALAEIHSLGVTVHTREDGDVTITRAADVLKPILRVLTGALENEARSDKSKAGHARRRAAGKHIGREPFGVVLIDGVATIFEPEAHVVRELFERAADGWGYSRLAQWAATEAPTKRLRDGRDKPMKWAASTVASVLHSPTLRTVGLISESLDRRMRKARAADFRERAPARWPWPLRGAVRCTCGRLLSGHTGGVGRWLTRYYFCRAHPRPPGTTYPAHRADDLEAAFVGILRRLVYEPGLVLPPAPNNALDSLSEQEKAAKKHLAELERRKRRAWELAEAAGIDGKMLRERLDEIDDDRKRTRVELDRVQLAIDDSAERKSVAALTEVIAELAETWHVADVTLQQQIAQAVAALTPVGGLWAAPEHRNELFVGADVAKLRLCEPFRRYVPRGTHATLALLRSLVRN